MITISQTGDFPFFQNSGHRRHEVFKFLQRAALQYYSYILQIVYVISEENKLLPPYLPHLKNFTTLPCKMQNLSI